MRSSDSGARMDRVNTTPRPSDMYLQPAVFPTSHALHMIIIRMVLPKEQSVQSVERLRWCWSTPTLPFRSGEIQSILWSISINNHRMKAWTEKLNTMVMKHRTKRHTRRCLGLPNRCTMLLAMKYCIIPLFTTHIYSAAVLVDFFTKFNATRASSAQGRTAAWW